MARRTVRTAKTRWFSLPFLLAGVTLLTVAITGCELTPTHTDRASDQWSNGKLLGTAILNNRVALQVDEAGSSFVVWIGSGHELNFVRLSERGQVAIQRSLGLRSNALFKPQLLMGPQGQLHLIWLERRKEGKGIYYARLDRQGQVVFSPTRLTGPEKEAGYCRAVLNQTAGQIEVFWSDERPSHPGVYHLALDLDGEIVAPGSLIVPQGIKPDAQIDSGGFVHLVWSQGVTNRSREVFYAIFDPAGRFLSERTEITSFTVAPGQVIHGPIVGIDAESGYVFWTLESRARESMVSHAFHTTFPLGQLERQTVAEIQAPDEGAPQFDPDRGRFNYYYTAPHEGGSGVVPLSVADTDFLAFPSVTDGQRSELVVTFNGRVYARNTDALQIVVLVLMGGQLTDYQIVNDSRAASLQPNVAVDASGNLHLVWIDTAGFNRYQVVYASTSPQVKETLNRITAYDVVDRVLGTAMSVFTAFVFIPIVLSWMIVPIGGLATFIWRTNESEITDPRGRTALGVAMLVHLVVKVVFFPGLLDRFAFSSVLSPTLGLFLGRWVLPLLLAALSVGAVRLYLKRVRGQSIFVGYLIYAAVDAILTVIVYLAPSVAWFRDP